MGHLTRPCTTSKYRGGIFSTLGRVLRPRNRICSSGVGGLFYAFKDKCRVLLSTRLSRVKFIIVSVASSKFLGFSTANKVSGQVLPTARIIITKGRVLHKIVSALPPRLRDKSGGVNRVSSFTISVNFSTRGTGGLVPVKDEVCFLRGCSRLVGNGVYSGYLSSEYNTTTLIATVPGLGGLPLGFALVFSSRRRINAHNTTYNTFNGGTSRTVTISISFKVSPKYSGGSYNRVSGNTVVNYSPVLSQSVFGTLARDTGGTKLSCRVRIVGKEANAGTSIVRLARSNVGYKLVSVPLHCVRSPTRMVSITSIRGTTTLVTRCTGRETITLGTWKFVPTRQSFKRKEDNGGLCGQRGRKWVQVRH